MNIVKVITLAVDLSLNRGIETRELWLGPREYGELLRLVEREVVYNDLYKKNEGGEWFDGMLIKHATESCVRVGVTVATING